MGTFRKKNAVYAEVEPGDATRYQLLVVEDDGGNVSVSIGAGTSIRGGYYVPRHVAESALKYADWFKRGAQGEDPAPFIYSDISAYQEHAGVGNQHTVLVAFMAAACWYWGDLEVDLCRLVEEFYRPSIDNGVSERLLAKIKKENHRG